MMLLMLLMTLTGQEAWAENGWTIQASHNNSTNVTTFTITRTNTAVAETVKYRFVNLSAYAGQHYNVTQVNGENKTTAAQQTAALSGEFTFTAGETEGRTIQVTESAGSGAYSYYKDDTQRSYKLEVIDAGGFYLTSNTRSFTKGTSINSSNVYAEQELVINNTSTITVTDGGYDQAYHSVTVDNYYSAAAPKSYLSAAGAQLRMTVTFDAREKDNGYQYVAIYANTATSNVDTGAKDGNPGTISYSRYMAGFTIDGNVSSTYYPYTFPLTSKGSNCGEVEHPWANNSNGNLVQQYFNTNCRATDGRLIIPTELSSLYVRFNASGNLNDSWYAQNVKAHIQAVDVTNPTVLAYSVAPGYHAKGNTVYVSVAFNEIVKVTGTPTLSTTSENKWGSLNYVAGSGSNVLTFSTTIPANASGSLNITGLNGTVKDLEGNSLTGSSVTATNLCFLDANYSYTISYNLNEGSVATANPTFYNYTTATFTLNNPTKTGYTFNGWTGSNGNTANTTVKITQYSHGNKSYTANWTVNTYTITCELAGGSVATDNPTTYTIESADITLTNPTRTGYSFAGWTGTGLNEATQSVTIAHGSTGNRSYITRWTGNSYTVRFHKNHDEATGTMADQGFTYGNTQKLTANAFTRTGYAFVGWNTRADGSGTSYIDEHSVKNLTATDGGVFDLYAQWIAVPTYIDADGTEQTPDEVTFITSSRTSYGSSANDEAWYVVPAGEVTISGSLNINDKAVHLILCDGAELNINKIDCDYGSLTIYGQTQQSGRIEATVSGSGSNAIFSKGDITINGGTVSATASSGAIYAYQGNVIINRGSVTATASSWESIYAGRYDNIGGDITFNGGIVSTHGYIQAGGDVTINGGTVTLDDGVQAEGNLTINGGILNLNGTSYLYDDDSTQPDGYKNAVHIAALADGNTHVIKLYGRTLYKDGKWNTLCLPFDFDAMHVEYFLKPEKLMTLSTSSFENGTLTLNFADATTIEAGKPYIIKWKSGTDITNPSFPDVIVKSGTTATATDCVNFIGTTSSVTLSGGNTSVLYLGSGNNLYYPASDRTIGAFRAYFELSNGLTVGDPASPIKEFKMNFGNDDDADGIGSIHNSSQSSGAGGTQFIIHNDNEAIYNLAGQRLQKMQRGINIVNGKKVLK